MNQKLTLSQELTLDTSCKASIYVDLPPAQDETDTDRAIRIVSHEVSVIIRTRGLILGLSIKSEYALPVGSIANFIQCRRDDGKTVMWILNSVISTENTTDIKAGSSTAEDKEFAASRQVDPSDSTGTAETTVPLADRFPPSKDLYIWKPKMLDVFYGDDETLYRELFWRGMDWIHTHHDARGELSIIGSPYDLESSKHGQSLLSYMTTSLRVDVSKVLYHSVRTCLFVLRHGWDAFVEKNSNYRSQRSV